MQIIKDSHLVVATIATIAAFLLLGTYKYFASSPPDNLDRFVAGYVLGTLASISAALLIKMLRNFRSKGISALDRERKWIPFSAVAYLMMAALIVVVWIVGWEGENTGVFYGAGILLAGILVTYGVGHFISKRAQA